MAAIGKAALDVHVTVKDLVAVRQRSLELAIESGDGYKFREVIDLAKAFEEYILEGKTPVQK